MNSFNLDIKDKTQQLPDFYSPKRSSNLYAVVVACSAGGFGGFHLSSV